MPTDQTNTTAAVHDAAHTRDLRIRAVAQTLLISAGLGSGTCIEIARTIVAKLDEMEAR